MDTWRGLRRPMDSRRLSVLLLEDFRRNIVGYRGVVGMGLGGSRIWRLLMTKGGVNWCTTEIEGIAED